MEGEQPSGGCFAPQLLLLQGVFVCDLGSQSSCLWLVLTHVFPASGDEIGSR